MDKTHFWTLLLTVAGGGATFAATLYYGLEDPKLYAFSVAVAMLAFRIADTRTTRAVNKVTETLDQKIDSRLAEIQDRVGEIRIQIEDAPVLSRRRVSTEKLYDLLKAKAIGDARRSASDFDDGAWRTPLRMAAEIRNDITAWLRDNAARIEPELEAEAKEVLGFLNGAEGLFSAVHYAVKANWDPYHEHFLKRADAFVLYEKAWDHLDECRRRVDSLGSTAARHLSPSG
ncbi:hypothetical protein JYT20_01175 [Rhodothermus sp. AH-315-K08]|nr:hypothetical protein [Rhodothermus sp. AH-315-K08]